MLFANLMSGMMDIGKVRGGSGVIGLSHGMYFNRKPVKIISRKSLKLADFCRT